ncbi:MAG: PaaI family thioesterase [Chromatocurvus sp.]
MTTGNDETSLIPALNARRPAFLDKLGGQVVALDRAAGTCTLSFDISTDYCHSVDIIQGGFVTAMLDAAASHAAFALVDGVTALATLEIKVSFLEPSRAGAYRAVGIINRVGQSTAFMSGELYSDDGHLTAMATTTARLIRKKEAAT